VWESLQLRIGFQELAPGQERVDGFALRYEADLAIHPRITEGGATRDRHRARRWGQQPGDQVQERALAGSVRSQQAGDAGLETKAHLVDRHHVSVPARDAA